MSVVVIIHELRSVVIIRSDARSVVRSVVIIIQQLRYLYLYKSDKSDDNVSWGKQIQIVSNCFKIQEFIVPPILI